MSSLVAALLLAGFFLALTAFWCWSRARELALDADLQRRLGEHGRQQSPGQAERDEKPFDVAKGLQQRRAAYTWGAALLALLALASFGGVAALLGRLN